jgi:hypothetical protein
MSLDPDMWHVGCAVSKDGTAPDAVLLMAPGPRMYLSAEEARRMAAALLAQAGVVESGAARDLIACVNADGRVVPQ